MQIINYKKFRLFPQDSFGAFSLRAWVLCFFVYAKSREYNIFRRVAPFSRISFVSRLSCTGKSRFSRSGRAHRQAKYCPRRIAFLSFSPYSKRISTISQCLLRFPPCCVEWQNEGKARSVLQTLSSAAQRSLATSFFHFYRLNYTAVLYSRHI